MATSQVTTASVTAGARGAPPLMDACLRAVARRVRRPANVAGTTSLGLRGAPPTRKGASVARERPTASDVHDNDFAAHPSRPETPTAEIADIVLRAGRLGFPRWRVANALGVSPDELARIEQLDA